MATIILAKYEAKKEHGIKLITQTEYIELIQIFKNGQDIVDPLDYIFFPILTTYEGKFLYNYLELIQGGITYIDELLYTKPPFEDDLPI